MSQPMAASWLRDQNRKQRLEGLVGGQVPAIITIWSDCNPLSPPDRPGLGSLACWLSWHFWQFSILITENNYVGSNRQLRFLTKPSQVKTSRPLSSIVPSVGESIIILFAINDEIPEIAGGLKSMLAMINWWGWPSQQSLLLWPGSGSVTGYK